jgi:predicted glycosyltransferase
MRIWIDLGNSPHVPFFRALSPELERRGHEILWTARDYAQTVELANKANLPITVFGSHGGKKIWHKGTKFLARVFELVQWAQKKARDGKKIDLYVGHNSHEPLVAAKILGIKTVNLMDYEHHPANHLSFRLASKIIVPESFPQAALRKFGVNERKIRRFAGLKEDVYLADFEANPNFQQELSALGITPEQVLIVVRAPALEALYHRGFSADLFEEMLDLFAAQENAKIILLPRKTYQGAELKKRHPQPNIIVPQKVLDGANLIAAADLVISGGGTMNREAAALGVPVATIFAGKTAAIDEMLIRENRLKQVNSKEDLQNLLPVGKKSVVKIHRALQTRGQVADLILSDE